MPASSLYLRFVDTASAVRALIARLHHRTSSGVLRVVLIYRWDGWLVNVRLSAPQPDLSGFDLAALVQEHTLPALPDPQAEGALRLLDAGLSPIEVMARCDVPVIVCDLPGLEELSIFCEGLVDGLGYRPAALA